MAVVRVRVRFMGRVVASLLFIAGCRFTILRDRGPVTGSHIHNQQ